MLGRKFIWNRTEVAVRMYLKIGTFDRKPTKFSEETKDTLTIFWNPTITSATQLYNALFEIFRMPLQGIQMNFEGVSLANCRSWVNWSNDTSPDASVREFVGKCSFHTYISILKLVKTKNFLSYRLEPTDYPEDPETIEIVNIDMEKIIIRYGGWINVRQLKAISAQEIAITKVSFTDSQINSILREMRDSEGTSNFKKLYIIMDRESNTETVLEGMNVTDEELIKPDDVLKQWSFVMANGEKCRMIYACYDQTDFQEFGFELNVGI